MKKLPLRLRPKLKNFVNGYYVYNPIIDWYDVNMYKDMMMQDTAWLSELIHEKKKNNNHEYIGMAIRSRQRFSEMRKKIIRLLKVYEGKV